MSLAQRAVRLAALSLVVGLAVVLLPVGAGAHVTSAGLAVLTVDGPTVMLNPQAAQNFALALHELTTNAAKYGALSVSSGRVSIEWTLDPPGEGPTRLGDRFTFQWQERDGPPITKPAQKGFGSTVLVQVMSQYADLEPDIDFAREGLTYRVTGRLEPLAAVAEGAG